MQMLGTALSGRLPRPKVKNVRFFFGITGTIRFLDLHKASRLIEVAGNRVSLKGPGA
jgi:hypothetical protein